MFNHPLTLIGLCVASGGWAFLLFGVGVSSGYGSITVANNHAISIANNLIISGLAFFIAGVAAGVTQELKKTATTDIKREHIIEDEAVTSEKIQENKGDIAQRIAAAKARSTR
tara:strand:- start:788 stop:1126 length:339 start_codon:yes stop_codon:yes gene_type:complete